MDRFTSRIISYGEQQHINRYLLHAIIMNRISFRIVSNNFFLEFAKKNSIHLMNYLVEKN